MTDRQQEIYDLASTLGLKAEEISDGYHTFKELYEYRLLYNAAMVNLLNGDTSGVRVEKSRNHSDGTPCFGGGWFVVIIYTQFGQITNHYENKDWNLFACREIEVPSEKWDGHSPAKAKERLRSFVSKIAESTKLNLRRSGRSTRIAENAVNWLLASNEGQKVLVFPLESYSSSNSYDYSRLIHGKNIPGLEVPYASVIYDHYSQERPKEFRREIVKDLADKVATILAEKRGVVPKSIIANLGRVSAILIHV